MNKYTTILILFCWFSLAASAQNNGNPVRHFAPYSKPGLGYLHGDFYAWNFGMANVGLAHYDAQVANLKNPALLPFNKTIILDVNLGYQNSQVAFGDSVQRQVGSSINGIHLIVPITYKWTSGVSLTPVSHKAYGSSAQYDVPGTQQQVLQTDTSFGSIQRFSFSNGFTIAKGLNVGAAVDYTFGNLTDRTRTILDSGSTNLIEERADTKLQGLEYNVGIFYQNQVDYVKALPGYVPVRDTTIYVVAGRKRSILSKEVLSELRTKGVDYRYDTVIEIEKGKDGRTLQYAIGLTYGAVGKWSEREIRSITWASTTNATFGYDTTSQNANRTDALGVGLSIGNTSLVGRWTLAADLEWRNWSKYQQEGQTAPWANSSKIAIGFQYTPEIQSSAGMLKMTTYSVGAYRYNTPYMYSGKQLQEFGMHFGVSFTDRAKRSNESFRWIDKTNKRTNVLSRYNAGVAVGTLGYNSSDALQQMFVKVNIGISLNSEWFLRRKIN